MIATNNNNNSNDNDNDDTNDNNNDNNRKNDNNNSNNDNYVLKMNSKCFAADEERKSLVVGSRTNTAETLGQK